MESLWRSFWDWITVGTDTETPAPEDMPNPYAEIDPLTGDRDGLGHEAAPEDDRGSN